MVRLKPGCGRWGHGRWTSRCRRCGFRLVEQWGSQSPWTARFPVGPKPTCRWKVSA